MRMNSFRPMLLRFAVAMCGFALIPVSSSAESAPLSASELASRLSVLQQDGTSYVRLRMEINGVAKEILQIQIKQRRAKGTSEVVYQVLFPKERKGESVLLRQIGDRPASGFVFTSPNTLRPIGDLKEPLFGSALSYADIVENFFAWDQQAILGAEDVDGVKCQILESKPGKGGHSIYGSVRSWIDPQRLVPLRIEKYSSSGQLLRRIDTTRVVADGENHVPANLSVRGPSAEGLTQINGSQIKHDVKYSDAEFTADGLKELTAPRGSPD